MKQWNLVRVFCEVISTTKVISNYRMLFIVIKQWFWKVINSSPYRGLIDKPLYTKGNELTTRRNGKWNSTELNCFSNFITNNEQHSLSRSQFLITDLYGVLKNPLPISDQRHNVQNTFIRPKERATLIFGFHNLNVAFIMDINLCQKKKHVCFLRMALIGATRAWR